MRKINAKIQCYVRYTFRWCFIKSCAMLKTTWNILCFLLLLRMLVIMGAYKYRRGGREGWLGWDKRRWQTVEEVKLVSVVVVVVFQMGFGYLAPVVFFFSHQFICFCLVLNLNNNTLALGDISFCEKWKRFLCVALLLLIVHVVCMILGRGGGGRR